MPGFMGIRGLDPQNPHDKNRERREEHKPPSQASLERRAEEKAHEILKDQQGDMSAYQGAPPENLPGGRDSIADLGVGKIMSAKVAAISFDDNLLTVQGIFSKVKFRHLPVVEADGAIIGIISDRDFLRVASPFFGTVNEQSRDKEIMMRKVGTVMTRDPVCVGVDMSIRDAVTLMNDRKISCLPIVEPGTRRLLGIVTWKDVVRAYCPGAFRSSQESSRLRAGVTINPGSTESARLRAKAAESARLYAKPAARPDGAAAGDGSSREAGGERKRPRRSDTEHLPHVGGTPKIAATEKLRDTRTAGQAGSELAARQRELIRKQNESPRNRQSD